MLPEVQELTDALNAANDVYDEVTRETSKMSRVSDEDYNAWWARRQEARAARRAAHDKAWQKAAASENKLVAYVATRFGMPGDYPTEALTVLKALPATAEELEALSNEYGWCDTFDVALEVATDRGVIPGSEADASEARADLRQYLADHGMHAQNRGRIIELAQAMVTEALTKHGVTSRDEARINVTNS